jgi:hypothetical protein
MNKKYGILIGIASTEREFGEEEVFKDLKQKFSEV